MGPEPTGPPPRHKRGNPRAAGAVSFAVFPRGECASCLLEPRDMDPRVEAERLARTFQGSEKDLVAFLSGQLAVLKQQAQMIMGLCGLIITVTGFSGHNMVRAGPLSAGAMIAGISVVLVAILVTIRTLAKIRWVTQDLGDDFVAMAESVIRRRNREQRALGFAGACVAVGLGLYLVAVVLAAVFGGGVWTPP